MKKRANTKISRLIRKNQHRSHIDMPWAQAFEVLQEVFNKYFESGKTEWSPLEVAELLQYKTVLHDPILLDRLLKWQEKDYIVIVDKPAIFIRVKNKIGAR